MNSQRLTGCGTALVTPFSKSGEIDERSLRSFVDWQIASNIEAATTLELAEHENIIAVKEASGNLAQIGEIIRHRPARFSVLSGDDPVTLQVMADGGDGVVSVTSNAAPQLVARLTECAAAGNFASAREIHHQLAEWTAAAFVESNPIPVKAGLAMMGKLPHVLRVPLVPLAGK